jgi:hydroxymethylbilane synthase
MKDVPVELPQGLHLAVIMRREDPTDAFVSNNYISLEGLPVNAKIGTSSLRRQCQIKEKFPNAEILTLRGNVNTRLAKLDEGQYDAIILASAGLKRLGLAERITLRLEAKACLPAIGQGAIGIECRIEDQETNVLLKVLHDEETSIRVTAERAMNARLNGGCQVPFAGFAEIQGHKIVMRGLVGSPDGVVIYRAEGGGSFSQAEAIGQAIADDLLAQGADKILQAL